MAVGVVMVGVAAGEIAVTVNGSGSRARSDVFRRLS